MFNPYPEGTGEFFLVAAGVPPSKTGDCLEWAFGTLGADDGVAEMREAWNKRHNDIFIISKEDGIAMALACIGRAFAIDILKVSKQDPRLLRKNLKKSDPDIRSR